MPPLPTNQTITLEQAWHYLMSQYAYVNPGKIFQARLARKALANMMRQRSGR